MEGSVVVLSAARCVAAICMCNGRTEESVALAGREGRRGEGAERGRGNRASCSEQMESGRTLHDRPVYQRVGVHVGTVTRLEVIEAAMSLAAWSYTCVGERDRQANRQTVTTNYMSEELTN